MMTKRGLIICLVGFVTIMMVFLMTQKPDSVVQAQNMEQMVDANSASKGTKQFLPAPDVTFAAQKGEAPRKLSDHKGHVVVMDFWASWCGPCRMSIPELVKIYDKYKGQGLEVYGITQDEKTAAPQVEEARKALAINYPIVYQLDMQGEADKFNLGSIPALFVIDKKGLVRKVEEGYDPEHGLSKVDELVGQLLTE